jgi:hypothetical protein
VKKLTGINVWQDGYYERTLRSEEATLDVVGYILQNPVRKGLVQHPSEYSFSGSSIIDLPNLVESVAWRPERGSPRSS